MCHLFFHFGYHYWDYWKKKKRGETDKSFFEFEFQDYRFARTPCCIECTNMSNRMVYKNGDVLEPMKDMRNETGPQSLTMRKDADPVDNSRSHRISLKKKWFGIVKDD